MKPRRRSLTLLILLSIALHHPAIAGDPPWIARSTAGMVASDSPAASRIGARVLAEGGNAFDAAVATSLALAVARPQSTGLGGGGFMVAYAAGEHCCIALDFREMAPAAATPERYAELRKDQGDGPSASIYGGNAIGVPGQIAGLAEIHARFGTREWEALFAPAIELCEAGFVADEHFIDAVEDTRADIARWPQLKQQSPAMAAWLDAIERLPGTLIRRPALKKALEILAHDGATAFYNGDIADAIVRAVKQAGGELTGDDLRNYRVRRREPLQFSWNGYDFALMPPPSSGGVCIAETLGILNVLAEPHGGYASLRASEVYAPALVTALKHAFADRARWLGDPDASDIPVALLTSPGHARQLATKPIHSNDDFGLAQLPDDDGTSHFCVADRFGNVVAITETINGGFGSLVMAEPYGIILNNQLDDFLTVPGEANLFSLRQGQAALIGPGRRPLSSMSPTIVFRDGRPVLAIGASGGPRIITSTLQVMLGVLAGEPFETAMQAVRLHHQWRPDEVFFDEAPPEALAAQLRAAGHQLSQTRKTGIVQAIQFTDTGQMIGASDPRKAGQPAAP